jgi:hypothetical protein
MFYHGFLNILPVFVVTLDLARLVIAEITGSPTGVLKTDRTIVLV